MKYKGVFVLSVRTYLGLHDGNDTWMHQRYIVGIKEEDKIVDFVTSEVYNFAARNEKRDISLQRGKVKTGESYAIEIVPELFDKNKTYSAKEIKKFIKNSELFTEEYKNCAKKKPMMLIK